MKIIKKSFNKDNSTFKMRNVHSTFKMKNTHFTDELSFHNHNSSLLRIFLFCDTEVSLSFCLRPHSGDFDQAVEMV